jgi:hypothetical protein
MDSIQQQHEQAIGQKFIAWYNAHYGTNFALFGRGAAPPDLIYKSDTEELFVEVSGGYYDEEHAKMLWQNARHVTDASTRWTGKEPDQTLVDHISAVLEKKAAKQYPGNCVLVVNTNPDITSADEFAELLGRSSETAV